MPDNFDEYLKTAIEKKNVPLALVDKRDDAEFEITGYSETEKACTAKKIIMESSHSRESASIKVANLKTSTVVFVQLRVLRPLASFRIGMFASASFGRAKNPWCAGRASPFRSGGVDAGQAELRQRQTRRRGLLW